MINLKRNIKFCQEKPKKKLKIMHVIEENKNSDNSHHNSEALQQQYQNSLDEKIVKLFEDNQDQEQFENIVVSLEQSELGDILSRDISVVIASFATGEFLPCCYCNEINSFLSADFKREDGVICVGCESELWEHFCEEEGEKCTATRYIGPICEDCDRRVCYDCYEDCGACHQNTCFICSHDCKFGTCQVQICDNCWDHNHFGCYKCMTANDAIKSYRKLYEEMIVINM